MKKLKKRLDLTTFVAIASLIVSIVSMVWVGGFRMSTLIHEVQDLKDDMKEVKGDIKEIREEIKEINNNLHKMDIRVNTLEQRK